MFSTEVLNLLISVLSSWEVIAVSVAIVLYLFLVFYVARLNRPPRSRAPKPPKGAKAPKPAKNAAPEPEDVEIADEE